MPNKQPWLIDGEALEAWLTHLYANFETRHTQLYNDKDYETAARMHARMLVVRDVLEQFRLGRFNAKDEQTA